MGEFSHIICEDLAWTSGSENGKFRVSHYFREGHVFATFQISAFCFSIGPSKLSHLHTCYWAVAVRWVTQMIADFASA